MKTETGKFVRGSDRVADEVTVQIFTSNFPTPNDWSGRFTLPKGRRAELGKGRLILADGRAGEVILYKLDVGAGRTVTADFWGLSPLKRVG